MALISAYTIIRAISLFHITAAYFFLTAPGKIADQNVVFILGQAMRLPQVTIMDKPNEATGFIAVILTFLGIADLTAASLTDLVALEYWLSNVPARLTLLFGLTGYIYLFKEDGLLNSGHSGKESAGENLHNSLAFSWAFLELAAWFWVFTSLREERQNVARKILEQRKTEEDRQ